MLTPLKTLAVAGFALFGMGLAPAALAGPVVGISIGNTQITVGTPRVVVQRPVQPGPNYVWVEGHWRSGPRGNQTWIKGHWQHRPVRVVRTPPRRVVVVR